MAASRISSFSVCCWRRIAEREVDLFFLLVDGFDLEVVVVVAGGVEMGG